jgi:hypothetical protein
MKEVPLNEELACALPHQDYPQHDTIWYFAYCHYAHSQGFNSFIILCGVQLTFACIALVNIIPLSFLLYIEICIQKKIGWRRPVKFTALLLMILTMLTVFVHYFFNLYGH